MIISILFCCKSTFLIYFFIYRKIVSNRPLFLNSKPKDSDEKKLTNLSNFDKNLKKGLNFNPN